MNSNALLARVLRIVGESRRQKHLIGEKYGYEGERGSGRILHVLTQGDTISQKELAAKLDIRPQSLTTALIKLEDEGFIRRERNESDKREQYILLTEEGKKIEKVLHAQFSEAAENLFSCLNEQEAEILGILLEKVTQSFASKEEETP